VKSVVALAAFASLALGSASFVLCGGGTAVAQGRYCCKICSTGKACGNSCIARWKTCHKGKGCACDG
jgi:hypothetical protein